MLLLVVDPQVDQRGSIATDPLRQQLVHGVIDVASVVGDLYDSRTRDQATVAPGVSGAGSFVVRVEQKAEVRMEDAVIGKKGDQ